MERKGRNPILDSGRVRYFLSALCGFLLSMSTQRMIKDSFWTDSYIANLDPSEKLLFIYLLTNPLCNIAGIYEIQAKRIAFDTGFDRDMVEKLLQRFQDDGKLLRIDEWLVIVNHAKHQSYKNPNVSKGIKRIIEELPEKVKALKGFERLSHLTLLNLTLPNLNTGQSPDNQSKDMSFKNMRRYKEDGHWEEPAIDAESGEAIEDEIDIEKAEERELNEKIRYNLRLAEESRGLPFGTGKDMAYHVKIYRELLKKGWSHEALFDTLLELINSDHWKKQRQVGQYPGMNTVQFTLRNKKPS